MDPHSEAKLVGVHPHLAAVIRSAAQSPQPFQVVYGVRTLAAEEAAVASGHSQTLHSRHLPDPAYPDGQGGGLAMAIDFACLTNNVIDWTIADTQGGIYGQAAAQILASARQMGIRIQWGGQQVGAWVDGQVSHFRDWGHIQLDPSAYP